jgi:hypothetical protein
MHTLFFSYQYSVHATTTYVLASIRFVYSILRRGSQKTFSKKEEDRKTNTKMACACVCFFLWKGESWWRHGMSASDTGAGSGQQEGRGGEQRRGGVVGSGACRGIRGQVGPACPSPVLSHRVAVARSVLQV